MKIRERKITKEIYDRALNQHGYIDRNDYTEVFTASEVMGYGIYRDQVFERNGEYFVSFELGDSCD